MIIRPAVKIHPSALQLFLTYLQRETLTHVLASLDRALDEVLSANPDITPEQVWLKVRQMLWLNARVNSPVSINCGWFFWPIYNANEGSTYFYGHAYGPAEFVPENLYKKFPAVEPFEFWTSDYAPPPPQKYVAKRAWENRERIWAEILAQGAETRLKLEIVSFTSSNHPSHAKIREHILTRHANK